MPYDLTFSPQAWEDFKYWEKQNPDVLRRLHKLLQELQRDGAVQGLGKAERLRHRGQMSKRIDKANRLIYEEGDNQIYIISCRGHY